jgi:ABC-2 type transport system permease protein
VGTADARLLILTGLGVVVPLATILAAVELAPGFKEALARLEAAPERTGDGGRAQRTRPPAFARWLTRQPAERAAYELVWSLSGRDRQFKLRTYPNVALIFILGAVFLLSDQQGLGHALATLPHTRKYLILLYMCCAMAPVGFIQMRFCDQFEAAWIYRVVPLATPGLVLRAGLKVALVRLVVPSFALVALVALLIWHAAILPDLVLAFCATVLTCTAQALLMGNRLPFSEPFGVIEGSGRVIRSLGYVALAGGLGWVHFALTLTPLGVPLAIPVVALAAWLALYMYGRRGWDFVLAEQASGSGRERLPSKVKL